MELIPLIIQLVSGAVGGNLTGAIFQKISLGTLGNSILGILGGGLGGQLLSMVGISLGGDGSLDLASIIGSVAGAAVGGGALMTIVGFIRSLLSK
ncbi:hypothetical protein FE810_05075 [Thalassotalea litorea]|uniref:DNA methyltransferase n=1 Tax=Thalassotalea litorea TaxID=2020715 RepID=A0A5R9IQK2_9GAMM|nr:hypothetical protein [Thalassotalea litorea]TLU66879.1 hypothetical protein FE810_05075 [Thalassotalea litorea]